MVHDHPVIQTRQYHLDLTNLFHHALHPLKICIWTDFWWGLLALWSFLGPSLNRDKFTPYHWYYLINHILFKLPWGLLTKCHPVLTAVTSCFSWTPWFGHSIQVIPVIRGSLLGSLEFCTSKLNVSVQPGLFTALSIGVAVPMPQMEWFPAQIGRFEEFGPRCSRRFYLEIWRLRSMRDMWVVWSFLKLSRDKVYNTLWRTDMSETSFFLDVSVEHGDFQLRFT